MRTTEQKKQEKQAPSSDEAVIERLTQFERKVDALCGSCCRPQAVCRAGRSSHVAAQVSE
jgi:hypothetical protein